MGVDRTLTWIVSKAPPNLDGLWPVVKRHSGIPKMAGTLVKLVQIPVLHWKNDFALLSTSFPLFEKGLKVYIAHRIAVRF